MAGGSAGGFASRILPDPGTESGHDRLFQPHARELFRSRGCLAGWRHRDGVQSRASRLGGWQSEPSGIRGLEEGGGCGALRGSGRWVCSPGLARAHASARLADRTGGRTGPADPTECWNRGPGRTIHFTRPVVLDRGHDGFAGDRFGGLDDPGEQMTSNFESKQTIMNIDNSDPSNSAFGIQKSWVANLLEVSAVLLRNWKIVALGVLLPVTVTVVGVMVAESTYRSTATIAIQPSRGGLTSLSSLSSSGLGSILGGGMNNPVDPRMESLLMSGRLADVAIATFRLDSVWKLRPDVRWESVRKMWNTNFSYEVDDNFAIKFGFIDHSPGRSAAVANFCVRWLDSSFQLIQREQAGRNLAFLESITATRMKQLTDAEDALVHFQLANKFWVPSEQIRQSVIQAATFEAETQKLDLQIQLGEETGRSQSSLSELIILREKSLKKLANFTDGKVSENKVVKPRVLVELNNALTKQVTFERLYRQAMIHGEVLKYLIQQAEQARIESQKTVSVLQVIDSAKVPQQRHSPKRMQLVQISVLLSFFMTCGAILIISRFRQSASEEDWKALRTFTDLFRRSRN